LRQVLEERHELVVSSLARVLREALVPIAVLEGLLEDEHDVVVGVRGAGADVDGARCGSHAPRLPRAARTYPRAAVRARRGAGARADAGVAASTSSKPSSRLVRSRSGSGTAPLSVVTPMWQVSRYDM